MSPFDVFDRDITGFVDRNAAIGLGGFVPLFCVSEWSADHRRDCPLNGSHKHGLIPETGKISVAVKVFPKILQHQSGLPPQMYF